jgi:hypothetical protein
MASEKDETVVDEARGAMLTRLRDPLILGYAVGFLGWNWRFFYLLAMPQGRPTSEIIDSAAVLLNARTYAVPLVVAALWAFVLPFLSALGFLARDYAAVVWERRARELRERADLLWERTRKQLREGAALSPREWREHADYRLLAAEARQATMKIQGLRSSVCIAWKKAWPSSIDGTKEAQVRVLQGRVKSGNFALRDGESVTAIGTDFRTLPPSERTRIVYVFQSIIVDETPDANLGIVVEAGGLSPWLHGASTGFVGLNQDGAVSLYSDGQQAEADTVATVRRCSPPHADWARFEVVQVVLPEHRASPATPTGHDY